MLAQQATNCPQKADFFSSSSSIPNRTRRPPVIKSHIPCVYGRRYTLHDVTLRHPLGTVGKLSVKETGQQVRVQFLTF